MVYTYGICMYKYTVYIRFIKETGIEKSCPQSKQCSCKKSGLKDVLASNMRKFIKTEFVKSGVHCIQIFALIV